MAVVIHGINRTTKDMDLFYEPTVENCEKVLASINEFGFKYLRLTIEDLMDTKAYIKIGNEPVRIDFFCDLPGVSFDEVFTESKIYEEDNFKVNVIHVNHLIQNKKVVARHSDLSDVSKLEKLIKKGKIK